MQSRYGTGRLDPRVSDRVIQEIETFTEVLEVTAGNATPRTLAELEQATDQLMRAAAGVLIEVGRLRSNHRDDV